ncbi:MAG: dTMP kinase [Pseudomonadota bacterium]|nr:dTMP kinase [Pseudomonadota bacterium]
MKAARGRFVSFEGGEGAGKSTVIHAVRERLSARGIHFESTREPGGTPLAEAIRALALSAEWQGQMCAETELLLVFAARAQHVRERVLPLLQSGTWVVADRFTDASFAYQGGGRGQPLERIQALEQWAACGLQPDLTFLLDVPVATGLARVQARGERDRIELEQEAFFERVRQSYLVRAAQFPQRFRVIDASRSQAEVASAVLSEFDAWLLTTVSS